jgi:hypothetical protein
MVIRTYTQTMPVLCVLIKGSRAAAPYRISATKIEDQGKTLTLKDKDGNVTGSFDKTELSGWWIEDDPNFSAR